MDDLRRAIEGDEANRKLARTDPDFDNIRGDPRFQKLIGETEPGDESEESPDK